MHKILDIKKWKRKEQFYFFKDYDNPFFNICSEVDITDLYNFGKENNVSFFIASLYATLHAANQVEEFRYRIREKNVIIHDKVHAGSTVLNDDETFNFCFFEYHKSFIRFHLNAKDVLLKNKENREKLDSREGEDNLIHYSVIPWIAFSSISHARKFGRDDSIPKIVLGKYQNKENRKIMPISIEVHHSLMDGLHLAKYLSLLQTILDKPESHL